MQDVLDDIDSLNQKEITLFSKTSIIIVSILFSPFYGAYLYCSNLRFSNQKNKINRTFIAIILSYLMVFLPFMGFELPETPFQPRLNIFLLLYFARLVVSLLITIVFWKKHFEKVTYKTIFPWLRVISIIIIEVAIIAYRTWIYSDNFAALNLPLNKYFIDFSLLTTFAFIFYFSFGDFIIRLIFSKKSK